MSAKTKIEWTDKSSNPLRAYHVATGKRGWFCVHASPGCTNCYAERRNRWIGNGLHYRAQDQKLVRFEMNTDELRSWQRLTPGTKVFPFDMTDLFQDGVPNFLIDLAFSAMGTSPATFQVLTKRAERLRGYVSDWYRRTQERRLPNVWLGVSVEDQARVEERVPELLGTSAAVRFLSVEPLLEEVNLYLGRDSLDRWSAAPPIDWVIVGGESGPGARPMNVEWARSVVRQCRAADVPVFVKQLGTRPYDGYLTAKEIVEGEKGRPRPADQPLTEEAARAILGQDFADVPLLRPVHLADRKGGDMAEWPEDLRVREFPKGVTA